jgi:hypothetical protein
MNCNQITSFNQIRTEVCNICLHSIEEKVYAKTWHFFRLNERFFGHIHQESTGLQHLHIRCFDCDSKIQDSNKCHSCHINFGGRQLEFIVNRFTQNVAIRNAVPRWSFSIADGYDFAQRFASRCIHQGTLMEGIKLGGGTCLTSIFLTKALTYTSMVKNSCVGTVSLGLITTTIPVLIMMNKRSVLPLQKTISTTCGIALGTFGASLAIALDANHMQLIGKKESYEALCAITVTTAVVFFAFLHITVSVIEKILQQASEIQRQPSLLYNDGFVLWDYE